MIQITLTGRLLPKLELERSRRSPGPRRTEFTCQANADYSNSHFQTPVGQPTGGPETQQKTTSGTVRFQTGRPVRRPMGRPARLPQGLLTCNPSSQRPSARHGHPGTTLTCD